MENKLYSVQYLRGLAAVLVVIAHAAAHPLSESNYVLLRLGQLGVMLFFVISGFIMVAITGRGSFAPLTFLKRRIVRVVPLYWLVTTVTAALALALPALFHTTVFTWPHYIQSLLFIPHEAPGRGGTSPLLSLGWTLNYEAFFYVAFALCAALAATQRVVVLSVAFAGLAVIGVIFQPQDPALSFYTNQAVLGFVVGAWIGCFKLNGGVERLPETSVWLLLVAGGLAAGWAFIIYREPQENLVSFACLVLFSSALMLAGLRNEMRLPRIALLETLGDASYAIYLTHMFVIGLTVTIATRVLPDVLWAYLGLVTVSVMVALVAGLAVHRWVEMPMLRTLRRRRAGANPGGEMRPA